MAADCSACCTTQYQQNFPFTRNLGPATPIIICACRPTSIMLSFFLALTSLHHVARPPCYHDAITTSPCCSFLPRTTTPSRSPTARPFTTHRFKPHLPTTPNQVSNKPLSLSIRPFHLPNNTPPSLQTQPSSFSHRVPPHKTQRLHRLHPQLRLGHNHHLQPRRPPPLQAPCPRPALRLRRRLGPTRHRTRPSPNARARRRLRANKHLPRLAFADQW